VNGQFIKPHGKTVMDLINPSTKQVIGQVTLGDEKDTQDAIAAAKAAYGAPGWFSGLFLL